MAVPRATVDEVRDKLKDDSALLICAYDEDEKFKQNHLEGALSMKEFKAIESTLPRDREIVFYCH
jgi:hypothetical protein